MPTKSITLSRNPAWKASADQLRKAYVNAIQVTMGGNEQGTQQLAGLNASNDPRLVIGPSGDNFITINPYIAINLQSPNNNGALGKFKVRQALEYAFNKTADSQVYGGKVISQPLNQVIPKGSVGNIANYNPYPTPGNNGDPAKAKKLLKQAGYQPGQITLKLVYRTTTVHPQIAQIDQAALKKAGFNVKLIAVNLANTFYTKYLQNPTATKNGSWDIAEAGWIPDWLGNNGRSVIEPIFDGRNYGPGSTDYGDYNSPQMNSLIDKALAAPSKSEAAKDWQAAAKLAMKDAVIGNLGFSYVNNVPVTTIIKQDFPITASVAIGGAILWLVIGVVSGVLAATHPRSAGDRAVTGFALFFYSARRSSRRWIPGGPCPVERRHVARHGSAGQRRR